MRYDPTRQALYHPEQSEPAEGFSADWPADHICAELSRLAYYHFEAGDAARLNAALAGAGFAAHEPFVDADRDSQAFGTVAPDGTLYVAFRGTQADKIEDLKADLKFIPGRWEGEGIVHGGFRDAYRPLMGAIDIWVASHGEAPLIVTGHSLGAALATLMAALHKKAVLITFGSPRVGASCFVRQFKGRDVRRYVDCTDVVTWVPPPLGAGHVSRMIYIDGAGRVHPDPPNLAARMLDRAAARLSYWRKYSGREGNVLVRMLADHAPVNYISAVLGRREPEPPPTP